MERAIEIVKKNQIESNQWQKEAAEARESWGWMKYSMQIALKVRSIMKSDGITQCALAAKLGCTQQYVSLILKGKENLTLETIAKLESALQIDLWGQSCMVNGYQLVHSTRQYLSDSTATEYGKCKK
ncbi:MAG: helix-turn-helix transcriptional regulator [Bacteroidales bacterium]|nr:helix-turn-helix transcriptional regulator [Bacteroidales bacterium]